MVYGASYILTIDDRDGAYFATVVVIVFTDVKHLHCNIKWTNTRYTTEFRAEALTG